MTISKLQEGLVILAKYGDQDLCVAHDMILIGPDASVVSDEDKAALDALGWFEHDEGGWAHFV